MQLSPRLSGFTELEVLMQSLLWTAVTVAFFVLAIAYVHFCERVK